jgi:hypothetical protein
MKSAVGAVAAIPMFSGSESRGESNGSSRVDYEGGLAVLSGMIECQTFRDCTVRLKNDCSLINCCFENCHIDWSTRFRCHNCRFAKTNAIPLAELPKAADTGIVVFIPSP